MDAHQGKTIGRRARAGAGAARAAPPAAQGRAAEARYGAGERLALLAAFAAGAASYWLTVFPRVALHIARWRRRALRMPGSVLRGHALDSLEAKRSNIEGACAFAAFAPWRRRGQVIRACASFQGAYNMLDILGEQPSEDPIADGRRLHEALLYALDPDAPRRDWYEHHPQHDDGGYLDSLLQECRAALATLPSRALVAPMALVAAERIVSFQSLNLSEAQGDHSGLESWARAATPAGGDLRWWETAAAAGSSLGVHVLIAAAARADLSAETVQALADAYFPWIGGLHSLLDTLVDKHEDETAGHRSLIEYYGPQRAAQRLRMFAERAAAAARSLPHRRWHAVILAGMVGNYVSTLDARSPELRPIGAAVLSVTGPLARPTMLVFRLRRLRK